MPRNDDRTSSQPSTGPFSHDEPTEATAPAPAPSLDGGASFNTLEFDDTTFDDTGFADTAFDAGTDANDASAADPETAEHHGAFDNPVPERQEITEPQPQPQPSAAKPGNRSRAVAGTHRNDVVTHSRRNRRTVRVVAYVVGLAALIGGVTATVNHHNDQRSAADARGDERASRDEIREAVDPTTPAPTLSQTIGAAPTPTAAPTTPPAPTTPAKTTPPTKAAVKPKKTPVKAALAPVAGCSAYSGNQLIACNLLPSFGFGVGEMAALVPMWNNESGWNASAANPSSGAYGIPQALPGSKMASAGSDWQTNPATQIKWGLDYIKQRYGSPSSAWSFWQANGWY